MPHFHRQEFFSPDYSGESQSNFVPFATRSHCVVFYFVHRGTSLAQVEFSFISGINTSNFKKSSVLSLVPETLIPAKMLAKVAFQTDLPYRNTVPSRPPQIL
jgi:hypothetical protein